MVSASLRAGTIATTLGHRGRGSGSMVSSRSCQKLTRAKKRYSQMASGIVGMSVDVRGTRYCATRRRRELCQIFGADRQPADGLAGNGKNGIAQGRRNRRSARLAATTGRFVARHNVHFDLGHLVHAQQVVVIEIALLDAPLGNGDLAFEGRRETVDDTPFHLRGEDVWLDMAAAAPGAYPAADFDLAGLAIDGALRHLRHNRADDFNACSPAS